MHPRPADLSQGVQEPGCARPRRRLLRLPRARGGHRRRADRADRSPGGRLERMTRVAWRLYRAAVRERADVYHLHDPELLVGRGAAEAPRIPRDLRRPRGRAEADHEQALDPAWARPLVSKATALVEQLGAASSTASSRRRRPSRASSPPARRSWCRTSPRLVRRGAAPAGGSRGTDASSTPAGSWRSRACARWRRPSPCCPRA